MKTQIIKILVENDKTITFTLKTNAFNVFEEPDNNLWTFDLEGRLVGMYIDDINYRRTLDNIYFKKTRYTENKESFRDVFEVPREKVEQLLNISHLLLKKYQSDLPETFQNTINNILKMDFEMLQNSAYTFTDIYLPISILPPDQYMSLVIQLTEGCNYNQCTFCNFYRDRPFKIKSNDELDKHLTQVKQFFGAGISLRKSIFLADANALAIPQKRLVTSLESINKQFPQFKNIYSFIDVFTGIKKSTADFKQLADLGLKRVYLGIESGNPELIQFLNKQQYNNDIIKLVKTIKSGGVNVGIIFLVGAGGKIYAEAHQKDSLTLIEQLPLTKGDMIYLSELYETNPEYLQSLKNENILKPSRLQIREWSNEFKTTLKAQCANDIKVAVYDINQFFY